MKLCQNRGPVFLDTCISSRSRSPAACLTVNEDRRIGYIVSGYASSLHHFSDKNVMRKFTRIIVSLVGRWQLDGVKSATFAMQLCRKR